MNKADKRKMFLQSSNIVITDEDVEVPQYEEDSTITTKMNDKVTMKLDQLRLETTQNQDEDIYNVNQQMKADIEYYKKLRLTKTIDHLDQGQRKELIANVLISDEHNTVHSKQEDLRNAWILKSVQKNNQQIDDSKSQTNNSSSHLIKSGRLLKQICGLMSKWKEHIFELYSDRLLIFSEREISDKSIDNDIVLQKQSSKKNKQILTDSVNFKQFDVKVDLITEDNQQVIDIKVQFSELHLKLKDIPHSYLSVSVLKEQISKAIQELSHKRKYKSSIQTMNNAVKFDTILEHEFITKAKSGDVVLFQSEGFAPSLQRTTTSSKFDHVGIIIKLRDGDVRIFDAVGDGVFLTEWNRFLHQNRQFETICLRSLNYKNIDNVLPQLYSFVSSAYGSKYSLNLSKIVKMTSIVSDFQPQQSEGQTYFCSELVAKCFKEMGIINQITSSTQYWPRSFSTDYDDKELILYDHAQLEHEQMVVLERKFDYI